MSVSLILILMLTLTHAVSAAGPEGRGQREWRQEALPGQRRAGGAAGSAAERGSADALHRRGWPVHRQPRRPCLRVHPHLLPRGEGCLWLRASDLRCLGAAAVYDASWSRCSLLVGQRISREGQGRMRLCHSAAGHSRPASALLCCRAQARLGPGSSGGGCAWLQVHEELISFASKSTNGRGGMMAKVEAAWMAAEQGCSVVILNGKKNDSILQVDHSTFIQAASGQRFWLIEILSAVRRLSTKAHQSVNTCFDRSRMQRHAGEAWGSTGVESRCRRRRHGHCSHGASAMAIAMSQYQANYTVVHGGSREPDVVALSTGVAAHSNPACKLQCATASRSTFGDRI